MTFPLIISSQRDCFSSSHQFTIPLRKNNIFYIKTTKLHYVKLGKKNKFHRIAPKFNFMIRNAIKQQKKAD